MRLTKTQLKEIIKEELEKALKETDNAPPEPSIEKQIRDAKKEQDNKCEALNSGTPACREAMKRLKVLIGRQREQGDS